MRQRCDGATAGGVGRSRDRTRVDPLPAGGQGLTPSPCRPARRPPVQADSGLDASSSGHEQRLTVSAESRSSCAEHRRILPLAATVRSRSATAAARGGRWASNRDVSTTAASGRGNPIAPPMMSHNPGRPHAAGGAAVRAPLTAPTASARCSAAIDTASTRRGELPFVRSPATASTRCRRAPARAGHPFPRESTPLWRRPANPRTRPPSTSESCATRGGPGCIAGVRARRAGRPRRPPATSSGAAALERSTAAPARRTPDRPTGRRGRWCRQRRSRPRAQSRCATSRRVREIRKTSWANS